MVTTPPGQEPKILVCLLQLQFQFTDRAIEAVADVDPVLAEPLAPDTALERFRRLSEILNR